MRRRTFLSAPLFPVAAWAGRVAGSDARLRKAYRRPEKNGWIYVRLEGSPREIGYQHGSLLQPEIEDAQRVIAVSLTHDSKVGYSWFRDASEKVLLPRVESEYREELDGIAEGLKSRGSRLDLIDVVTMNAYLELGYYKDALDRAKGKPSNWNGPAEHCSAFVATGSYTRDGRPVIAHNNWSAYREGARWNIIFDIQPSSGKHLLMDGMPGLIHSGDDFGVNSAGIMITETTISQFKGFDPKGVPEFVRARKAMQHSGNIADFARIMKDGNNGGYANTWLVADRKTNEIARLELGLKHVHLDQTDDGCVVGSNFPIDAKLAAEETDFPMEDAGVSANARRVRALQLTEEAKGKIDVAFAKSYLSDHYDSKDGATAPSERTLCGHIDLSPRGCKPWMEAYGTGGAVQAKAMDARMAEKMSFLAAMGHPCGTHFVAAEHLAKHPEYAFEREVIKDLRSQPWTLFQARG